MNKQVLSIEQMQHLMELGVDTDEASMIWVNNYQNAYGDDWEKVPVSVDLDIEYYQNFGRTFTLQDILDLLPRYIIKEPATDNFNEICYWLHIDYEYCYLFYGKESSYNGTYIYKGIDFGKNKSLIIAAYEMLCWVIENGFYNK